MSQQLASSVRTSLRGYSFHLQVPCNQHFSSLSLSAQTHASISLLRTLSLARQQKVTAAVSPTPTTVLLATSPLSLSLSLIADTDVVLVARFPSFTKLHLPHPCHVPCLGSRHFT